MLKKYNSHVTAICNGVNSENCIKMGATEVVDYTVKPFGEQLAQKSKFDIVFDLVGGKEIEAQSKPLLKKGAMYVTAVGDNQYGNGSSTFIWRILWFSMWFTFSLDMWLL